MRDFEGERYSLVFFTCGDHLSMRDDDEELLVRNGFCVPDKDNFGTYVQVYTKFFPRLKRAAQAVYQWPQIADEETI